MKIVADENIDKGIVDRLRLDGYDVLYIAEISAGVDDRTVLDRSVESGAVLLTADKDFGDLIFRQRLVHSGVVLIRLAGVPAPLKSDLVAATFRQHEEEVKTGSRCFPNIAYDSAVGSVRSSRRMKAARKLLLLAEDTGVRRTGRERKPARRRSCDWGSATLRSIAGDASLAFQHGPEQRDEDVPRSPGGLPHQSC